MIRQGSAAVPPHGDSPADQASLISYAKSCAGAWVVVVLIRRGRTPCPPPHRRRVHVRPIRARAGTLALRSPHVVIGPPVGVRLAGMLRLAPPTVREQLTRLPRRCRGTRWWSPLRSPRVGPPPRLPSVKRLRRLPPSSSHRWGPLLHRTRRAPRPSAPVAVGPVVRRSR